MADYHSLLMRAVANLPNAGTPATRGAIYGRAKKALLEQLRSLRPPLPESDIEREEKALDKAIAEIEGKYGAEGAAEPAPPAAAPAPPAPAAAKPGCGEARSHAASTCPHPAPGRARGVRAVRRPSATARPAEARSTRTHAGRADTAWARAAASSHGSGAQSDGRAAAPGAASADRACGEARRSRAGGGGFAGSIAADGCDGQFVFGPGRSFGRSERRQG